MNLEWKNPRIDGLPKTAEACFVEVNGGYMEIAYWNDTTKEWSNPVYGHMPRVFDDEGIYPPEIIRWAYIPPYLFEDRRRISDFS